MSLLPPVVPPPPATQYSLHASVPFHLGTETAVLSTLLQRSRAQHRSQLFLRHLVGVVRLARRVVAAVGAKGDNKDAEALAVLVPVFINALVKAAAATRRMIDLHHFMPLQTVLLGSYARLYAVALGLGRSVGLDGAALGLGADERAGAETAPPPELVAAELADGELGERVERAAVAASKRVLEAEAEALPSPSPSPPSSPEPPQRSPEPERIPPKHAREDSVPKTKKPKVKPVAGEDVDVPKAKKLKADGTTKPLADAANKSKVKPVAGDDAPKAKKLKVVGTATEPADQPAAKPKAKPTTGDALKVKKPKADGADTPPPKPKKSSKAKLDSTQLKKKKKRDAMDDIFGF